MPALLCDEGTILDVYPKSQPSSELFRTSENGNTVVLEYNVDNLPNLFADSTEQRMWSAFEGDLQLKPNSLTKLCRGRIRSEIRKRFELDNPKLKLEYFARNFMLNYSYELQRLEIMHYGLTSCCLKRANYSQTNITSKLNCKFKDYRKALGDGLDNLESNPKKGKKKFLLKYYVK